MFVFGEANVEHEGRQEFMATNFARHYSTFHMT